jgi:putative phosphoesterase
MLNMIAVISDSHVPNRAPEIPKKIIEKVEKADKTIHCGDFATEQVYGELEDFADELIAVKGNCDFFELENSETFEQDGIEIGVYHGTGITPRGDPDTLLDIAENKLEVDVLFHGHTHQEDIHGENGTLLLNPGSCTGVGGGSARPSNPTMMLVQIEESVKVELIELKEGEPDTISEESYDVRQFEK